MYAGYVRMVTDNLQINSTIRCHGIKMKSQLNNYIARQIIPKLNN